MNTQGQMFAWCSLAWLALLSSAAALAADAVLSPPNCNETGFNNALTAVSASGGGRITFNCGSAPATITFTHYKSISADIVIDGAERIIFDGNNASAFFQVSGGQTLTLAGLTLQHGVLADVHALESFGNLNLTGVTVKDNASSDSVIQSNVSGTLTILSSTFSGNAITGASGKGVVLDNLGSNVTIIGSTFSNNGFSTANTGSGGAIENEDGGKLYVYYSTFTGNHALDGGAIANHGGIALINDSLFNSNAAGYGGAIENFGGMFSLANSRFTNNTASSSDGGAIWNVEGTLSVALSEFIGNRQTSAGTTGGGAISCYDDTLFIAKSAFSANTSAGYGGAIYSSCAMAVTDSTFNANSANATSGGGGAIAQSGPKTASVKYATIAGNSAAFGGIYADGSAGGLLTLAKTMLAANTGGNCAGVMASAGYNLSSDTYCGGVFDPVNQFDLSSANLPLGAYQNNGGPTSSMLPAAGNQAIDRIPAAQCASTQDQRGASRPAGAACDSGAVELNGLIDLIFRDGFGVHDTSSG